MSDRSTPRHSLRSGRLTLVALFHAALALLAGCQSTAPVRAPEPVFHAAKLAEIDGAIRSAIEKTNLPGGVFWIERDGQIYQKAYGARSVLPERTAMGTNTIFDAASLTKVIATTPSIMLLVERGQIDLAKPVRDYIPEFAAHSKEAITVRQLLTHTSGLRPGLGSSPPWSGYDAGIQLACAEKPVAPPDTAFRYSDINFIVLGEIVRRVSGKPLDQFARAEVFGPLGMADTTFRPGPHLLPRIAPTEKEGATVLHGIVHDPTARRMDGVAGHAGLFTTAPDLARFARMMLNEGQADGKRLFRPETVRRMISVQTPSTLSARRGLGWDIDSPYSRPRGTHFPVGSYGHTGWTGTSIWIDPYSDTFEIFLSNRNHPTEAGRVLDLREKLGTLAAEAVRGFNFAFVPGALERRAPAPPAPPAAKAPSHPALNGIDVLVRDQFKQLRGRRVGLITNHTGADRKRNSTIDLLFAAPEVQLVALFSPEHGIRGLLDEKVSDSKDEKTGLPVFSLYGERRKPAPEQLQGLDVLVFDIQDIGCRFYTYISTMGLGMEAAAEAGIEFIVLDRINPIRGAVDGPILDGKSSFTAFHAIPVQHGLTVGELARLFNAEKKLSAKLTVIPCENWSRSDWFDSTGLPWINPSPNMRSLTEAALYPGIGLLETTSLSVGRGTDTPFEVIGAPYINDLTLASALNQAGLPGVRFIPVQFTPRASVYKEQLCRGVNIVLTDRETCRPLEVGVTIARFLHQFYPKEFGLDRFNRLLVHPPTVAAIRSGQTLEQIRPLWTKDLNTFLERRKPFLLYPE